MKIPRFTSSKPSKFAFASDEKSIRRPTTSFVRCRLKFPRQASGIQGWQTQGAKSAAQGRQARGNAEPTGARARSRRARGCEADRRAGTRSRRARGREADGRAGAKPTGARGAKPTGARARSRRARGNAEPTGARVRSRPDGSASVSMRLQLQRFDQARKARVGFEEVVAGGSWSGLRRDAGRGGSGLSRGRLRRR